ncbi:30S ribosomal protein S13 [Candidatus Micrarchaeota archaeon]|nr:30S ribosomal protein S13 [Candidatus Micrarchaeota archaeon]
MTEEKKKQSKKPSHEEPKETKVEESETFKGIVRLAGKDIRGHVPLRKALMYVRGIGINLSYSVAEVLTNELKIPSNKRIGDLTEQEMEQVDKILFNLAEHSKIIPKYMLNRTSDFLDGTDRHVIMNDLIFAVKQDIEKEKKAYSWVGYRHSYGQKVRGQRTRNTGRTGMAVGVLRKSIVGAAAAGKEGAAGAAAPAGKAATPAGGKAAPAEKAPAAKPTTPAKPAAK